MIRLNISAEGFSEEKFVTEILRPHLLNFNIYVEVRKILTNRKLQKRGGIVGYTKFKNDITQWFKECPDVYHSTFIDLYGLSNDFPGYFDTKNLQPYHRVQKMEKMLFDDMGFQKFIPYIQLHEYETLMYSDTELMENWLSLFNRLPINCFTSIKSAIPDGNPELINDGPETAPSKRILNICKTYDKVDDGILILKEIGLKNIRKECKHFDEWVNKLENLNI